ncbi:MAG: thiamine pyrophosphate-dependent dehydrogenase E1 component subunit alpha [Deltaproteobacteria bacterium]|nr:thiamine pyrophosphate-dependent dehydrogenase E1 component subunit alpha [Deltaproteobacteria bacterium]MBW2362502.1 thiamine pyrophosphate-dependent dehydrogenase E1 component subunit alpha [Deltaproteobacteria bacterium]
MPTPRPELLIEMQRRMWRVRAFDERAVELRHAREIHGPVHPSIGQEAACVGACMALREDDTLTGNHRSHGHPIAKGSELGPLMAELLGKATGVCGGMGGSMHLADFSVGSLGETGIVGAGIPIAVGAGLSARVRGTDQICIAFFGDGASNHGTFHESLNLAAIWKLPVLFFCENNGYAATTSLARATSVEDVAERAAGYRMPGVVVDGQDAVAVYEVTAEAAARARAGEGPSLLEAKTYRYLEHAEGEGIPGFYRDAAEIERWRQRDPLEIHRQLLLDRNLLDAAGADRIEREARAEVDAALAFARESAEPEPRAAFDVVFANSGGSGT